MSWSSCGVPVEKSTSYYLTVFVGTPLSIVSSVENLFLLYCFLQKRNRKVFHSYLLFFVLLAFFDSFISLSYAPVITVDTLREMLCWDWLTFIWGHYFSFLLAGAQTSMVACSYLILSATFERLLIIWQCASRFAFQRRRVYVAIGAISVGIAAFGSSIMDLEIVSVAVNDSTSLVYEIRPRPRGYLYRVVYKFWFRSIIAVLLPFPLLAAINSAILYKIKMKSIHARIFRFNTSDSDSKTTMRLVKWSLLVTVFAYLSSNAFRFTLTVWEHIDLDSLFTEYFEWYIIATDIISIQTLLNCASHLPIYLVFDRNIRNAVCRTLFGPKNFYKYAICDEALLVPLLHAHIIDHQLSLSTISDASLRGSQITTGPSTHPTPSHATTSNKYRRQKPRLAACGSLRLVPIKTGTDFDVLPAYIATGLRITPTYRTQLPASAPRRPLADRMRNTAVGRRLQLMSASVDNEPSVRACLAELGQVDVNLPGINAKPPLAISSSVTIDNRDSRLVLGYRRIKHNSRARSPLPYGHRGFNGISK